MGKQDHVKFAPEPKEDEYSDGFDESASDESGSEQEQPVAPPSNGHPQGPPTKKQKKQLTAQDIQVARETAELFKSNIFKLQIDELVAEVKLKDSHIAKIEKVLHRLHECISKIPEVSDVSLADAEARFNGKKVVMPFPDPKPSKVNYTFGYAPPSHVGLVGLFGLKTAIAQPGGVAIDMVLTMPQELFQPKDYLNYRALYKRAFYLAHVADHLIPLSKKHNLPIKISYHYLNEDILNPVLKLESIKTENPDDLVFHKTKFSINLIVGFPFGVFDAKKLLPDKNCIRVQTDVAELPPTPSYNSSLLSSTTYDYYLKYLYTQKKSTDSFKDACILGRLWLRQRGFGLAFNDGGFGHFEFAMLMGALLNGGGVSGNKILLHGFSSYQLFKGIIKYLAEVDLTSGYLTFSLALGDAISSKYSESGFDVPTVFDKNTKLNILWKMTKSSYTELRNRARDTLVLLNDVVKDRFDPILLQPANVDALRYDITLSLTISDEVYNSYGALEKISFITFDSFVKHKLFLILKNALGDRVVSLSIRAQAVVSSSALTKRKPSTIPNKYILGLKLNADECDKLVTKGPNNDDEELGIKFRTFWGSRASLRRFKDGTIQHCVVWAPEHNEPVVLSIIKYALDLHLHSSLSTSILSDITDFNNRLPTPLVSVPHVASAAPFIALKQAYENFNKVLVNLTLPLGVKALLAASPALRNSSLLVPVPFAVSSPDFWNDVVLQFETSTRWPDEISALEKTKTAFLIKISEALDDTAYRTIITKDTTIPFNEDISLLNVLTPEGYGFRIRVLTERDETLYLRAVANADKQRAIVQDIYLKFNQHYLGAVKHTRTVGILANHFTFYAPTVRLFKRWLDSQLLLHHFKDELVELIALKVFVDPAPYAVPTSVENGFLQIINFVSSWNWKEIPLILDLVKDSGDELGTHKLSEKLSIQAHQIIQANYDKIRKNDPSGIKTQFFIGSKDDPSGILWSNELTLPIASRLTALARAASQLIKTQGTGPSTMDLVFTPALKDYDFVIHLKGGDLKVSSGIMPANGYKNLINQTLFPADITSKYDLIQEFVSELNKKFGNTIIFSTRKYTGLYDANVIGGLFIPTTMAKKKFRVNLGINVKPADGDDVVINKDAILNQIALLGGDLIQTIKQ